MSHTLVTRVLVTVTDAALTPPELLAGISGEGPMNLPI